MPVKGQMAGSTFRFPIPDSELDENENWHSPYFFLAFFKARIALFEIVGITQKELREAGFAIMIKVLGPLEFFKPLKRGDIAIICPALKKIGNSSLRFVYEVYKEGSDELHAKGETIQLLAWRGTGQLCVIPYWIREKLDVILQP